MTSTSIDRMVAAKHEADDALYDAITRSRGNTSGTDLAFDVVDHISDGAARVLAVRFVSEAIDHERRANARHVEVAATRPAPIHVMPPPPPPLPTPSPPIQIANRPTAAERKAKWLADKARRDEERAQLIARFERLRDDPVGMYTDHLSSVMIVRYSKPEFVKHMGANLDPWYATTLKQFPSDAPIAKRLFEGDWSVGTRHRDASSLSMDVCAAVESEQRRIKLEVTQELLATVFALGDGTRVTWGQATVAQHTQRIALLVQNATGNMETAAKHQAAITMVQAAGVSNLNELRAAQQTKRPSKAAPRTAVNGSRAKDADVANTKRPRSR